MTHTRYGWSIQHTAGQLTHTRRSDGAPESDGVLQKVMRDKIRHHRQIYLNRPDPIAFMTVAVDTSGRVYDDFNRLLFLHAHGKNLLCLMNYRRNRINFVFFVLLVLKGSVGSEGVSWFNFGESIGHEDFCTAWSVVVVFYSFLHVLPEWHRLGVFLEFYRLLYSS